ncbi:ABC transporter ATP-binding protein [candidate division NPL-UPA2 bacterium]|nr:ABC transporter ATP-binding protein [candidate division NPL-UPA2 bacterium]
MLKLEKVTTGYDAKAILNDISFTLEKGDFLGVIGPNGSGKTTLLRVMSKILPPWKGKVTLEGRRLDEIKYMELAKRMAVVPQRMPEPFFSYSVRDFILLGRTPYLRRFQLLESEEDLRVVQEVMEETDTLGLEERNLEDLSGGERQRTIIAQALAQEPEILLLDEPTSHLDIGHQVEILDLVRKLNREKKVMVIMLLHDLNLASEYCDRLILLKEGSIFKTGTPEEVLTYEIIEEVYNALVIVHKNPLSSKPHILLVPKELRHEKLS